jgi:transcriptional regulator with XRE-family HTH domain
VHAVSAFGRDPRRQQLAEELRRLRAVSGLSGRQLAELLGVNQSTVTRIERGQQRVSVTHADQWAKATGAPEERRTEILALAEDALVGPRTWEETSGTGSANAQPELREIEAQTGTLCVYNPAAVPGLLQTASYAKRVFCSGPSGVLPDLAARVMSRMDRQQVLYDQVKRFRFVIPEAVLRWPFGPPDDPAVWDDHREQLARIAAAVARPNVELGVLPLQPNPYWRLGGFVLFDDLDNADPFVHIEELAGPVNVDDQAGVAMYRTAFDNLMSVALVGDQASELIAEVERQLHS